MVLEVVKYGHPTLRKKGARIASVTPVITELIANMFETMYAARGIGLAAQQVGEALQLTVLDVREASAERPSTLELNGKSSDPDKFMPLVLINPEIKPAGEMVAGAEGCLSFPEVFADISRPGTIDVVAMNEDGKRIEFRAGGLLARAIQHEADHLNGILFIDRMDAKTKQDLKAELEVLQVDTKEALKRKKPPSEGESGRKNAA